MSRSKVTSEERIEAAKAYIEGKNSQSEAARRLGVDERSVRRWVNQYTYGGPLAFKEKERNNEYSPDLKMKAVKEYLAGAGSLERIAVKYGLRSDRQLRKWIKVYNSGRDFEHRMSGGSRMKQGRETTQEERIAIVKDCLENGRNYGETAVRYNVSYQQVYTWVKKFSELGEAGLEDRRGKRMANQEPRSELEELKIRMAQLEHENYMLRMERDLLKKVKEMERRDAFRK
jgi:transposase-like protein